MMQGFESTCCDCGKEEKVNANVIVVTADGDYTHMCDECFNILGVVSMGGEV